MCIYIYIYIYIHTLRYTHTSSIHPSSRQPELYLFLASEPRRGPSLTQGSEAPLLAAGKDMSMALFRYCGPLFWLMLSRVFTNRGFEPPDKENVTNWLCS